MSEANVRKKNNDQFEAEKRSLWPVNHSWYKCHVSATDFLDESMSQKMG